MLRSNLRIYYVGVTIVEGVQNLPRYTLLWQLLHGPHAYTDLIFYHSSLVINFSVSSLCTLLLYLPPLRYCRHPICYSIQRLIAPLVRCPPREYIHCLEMLLHKVVAGLAHQSNNRHVELPL